MKLSCSKVQDNLLFHLEGDRSDPALSTRIEEHLSSCTECKERAASMQSLNRLLEDLPCRSLTATESLSEVRYAESPLAMMLARIDRKTLPEGLESKILPTIRRDRTLGPILISILKNPLLQPLTAAAAILLVSVLSFLSLDRAPSFRSVESFKISVENSPYTQILPGADPFLHFGGNEERGILSDEGNPDARGDLK